MIKVHVKQTNIPVILQYHQAAYLEDVPMALTLEYQVREHGLLIDSTCQRHKGIDDKPGRQMLVLPEDLQVPLVDRGDSWELRSFLGRRR